jgi:hypothetical protein
MSCQAINLFAHDTPRRVPLLRALVTLATEAGDAGFAIECVFSERHVGMARIEHLSIRRFSIHRTLPRTFRFAVHDAGRDFVSRVSHGAHP